MTVDRIVYISTWEIGKLHCLSFVYGLYLIVKRSLKWLWNPNKFFLMQQRDKPPPCLVDNNLGTHSYVKIKGVKFHYVEAGEKNGHLVLLLHGFPDCWLSWREQIPCLAEHYRVVAIDLKGFGDSDKPSSKRAYKIKILVEELRQFILTFGVRTCSIIGHDLGGLLGWYMVALHEDMIHKFAAISCPHPNFYWNRLWGESVFDGQWLHFSRLPFLPEIDALREDLFVINDTFRHLKVDDTNTKKNYVEAYKYTFSRMEDWTGPINYYRSLPFIRLNTESCDQICIKTLLIVGTLDSSVSMESITQSSEYVEKFSVKLVSGAKHFPHQEKPKDVNGVLLKFLSNTTVHSVDKSPSKSMMSSWLDSLTNTVKYGNQVLDVVHKRTNGVVNALPRRVLDIGHTTS